MNTLVVRPRGARAVFVLAHGAGAGMTHPFLESFARAAAREKLATLRFPFPYTEAGRKLPDRPPVLERTILEAIEEARALRLPIIAGGKSMGGRITSMLAARGALPDVRGLVFLGFPLHPANKPATTRAEHLGSVDVPMLFLQGTRDALADLKLLRPIVRRLPHASLHVIDGADHGFAAPARSGRTHEDVIAELARTAAAFAARVGEEPARRRR